MNRGLLALLAAVSAYLALHAAARDSSSSDGKSPAALSPIDLSGFGDSAHHWRNIRDETRFIHSQPGQPAYAPAQVRES
jgi:hypothetical protein